MAAEFLFDIVFAGCIATSDELRVVDGTTAAILFDIATLGRVGDASFSLCASVICEATCRVTMSKTASHGRRSESGMRCRFIRVECLLFPRVNSLHNEIRKERKSLKKASR